MEKHVVLLRTNYLCFRNALDREAVIIGKSEHFWEETNVQRRLWAPLDVQDA